MRHDAQLVPIDSVKPYKRNPRRGDVEAIRDSLRVNGQYRPLVVRSKTREVLAGNHTLQAAQAEGWSELWATFVDCDAKTARRIVLVDNRSNDLAGYDDSALATLLSELNWNLEGTGYDTASVERILAEVGSGDDPDTHAAAPPAAPQSRPGDLYILGEHRLLCGDATDTDSFDQVLAGTKANLLLTDPPYGVDYATKSTAVSDTHWDDIQGDNLQGDDLGRLLRSALSAAYSHAHPGAPAYVFHSDSTREIFAPAFASAGWLHKQTLIWAKQHFVLGRQDYQWQHEPILYGWRGGGRHGWFGGFGETTVLDDDIAVAKLKKDDLLALVKQLRELLATTLIREDKPHDSDLHPTMKPVALLGRLMRNSSKRTDAVLDPFGGSGSTLIAAENLGRRAFLIELDPGYCDVIVDRWERHTGKTAELAKRPKAA